MSTLTSIWPLHGLTLTTPRLLLRPIADEDIPAAVEAASSGIHDAGKSPFSVPWAELPPRELGPKMAQWYWQCRADFSPESWTLLLGTWHNGELVGCQDIGAKHFATLKTVSTGSWLKKSSQGLGLGKEMRAGVVLYAFDWLGAEVAESDAAVWNGASLGVSQSLGYELNGIHRHFWGGVARDVQHVRVTPVLLNRPDWHLQVSGHEAAACFFGAGEGPPAGAPESGPSSEA